MHIAYISYEHPLGIPSGGIGTYIGHMAKTMSARGHLVEVFSGSPKTYRHMQCDGYQLFLIPAGDKSGFKTEVLAVFRKRHSLSSFDVVECAEYEADGLEIKKAFPALPFVLKLHTPGFLTNKLNAYGPGLLQRLRFIAGGLIRFRWNAFYWIYKKERDPEYALFRLADVVYSPSLSLSKIVKDEWNSTRDIKIVPNPFPRVMFQNLPQRPAGGIVRVSFFGKLERRKGILDLISAIPKILHLYPRVEFHFFGSPSDSPVKGQDMITFMKKKLARYDGAIRIWGAQPRDKINSFLENSDICIIPSLWENFPYVCLEAMAMGKAVIGTDNGGMAEMIDDAVNGLLIPPGAPDRIFTAVEYLLSHPEQITLLGREAQRTVALKYNEQIIGQLTEEVYMKAITP